MDIVKLKAFLSFPQLFRKVMFQQKSILNLSRTIVINNNHHNNNNVIFQMQLKVENAEVSYKVIVAKVIFKIKNRPCKIENN